jgi:MGT family glycosyltransferase
MFDATQMVHRFYGKSPREFVLQGMLDLVAYYEAAQRLDRQYESHTADVPRSLECRTDLNLVLIARALQTEPERFDESYRFVGPCLSDRIEPDEFCWEQLGSDPLIYISMGTVFNDRPEFFKACMDALRELPVRVVMSVGRRVDPDSLGPVPANFLLTPFVQAPIAKLLERAALVIHHAGANTVQECARAGVPQLMFPQAGDQFMLADLVQQHGAGIRLGVEDIESTRLRELVQKVMSDTGYYAAAGVLRASVRTSGGTTQACNEILAFVKEVRK